MPIRLPLLAKVALALAAVALLPLSISFFQLRANEDALFSQVRRTHMVATSSAAERIDAQLNSIATLAESLAAHPVLVGTPQSVSSQELLRGTLQAQPEVAAIGIYTPDGDEVILAQRQDLRAEISAIFDPARGPDAEILQGTNGRWLRVRRELPENLGDLVLVTDVSSLEKMLDSPEIGEEALLILASRKEGSEVLAGASEARLEEFPQEALSRARSAKLQSEAARYADARTGSMIVGYSIVRGAPWMVLSRQPTKIAEAAKQRIRNATLFAALAALALTALFSTGAWITVVRPLRRLASAQQSLLGEASKAKGSSSEIEQLEASFEALQQRIQDSESLNDVFLGRYQVNNLIGSGAMGSVFRGWDPKLQRPVALKTIRLSPDGFDREKLVKSLLEEASVSARFNHPNIVTVYDMADSGSSAFIAMELVQGVSLDAYLWDRNTLSPEELIPLATAIARALAAAHKQGLVHHDVKPANVLLGTDNSIKVTDFGISQLISSAVKSEDKICGTPGYLAPEALTGEGYQPSSDLFALGLIMFEALVGKHPFFGKSVRETLIQTIMEPSPPIQTLVPDTPKVLADLIDQLLAKDPRKRPSSAAEVVRALEQMVHEKKLEWKPEAETLKSLEIPDLVDPTLETRLIDLPDRHKIFQGSA